MSCSDGRGLDHEILSQFAAEGQGSVPSPFFGLRPNYGGGNKDNVNVFQKVLCMHCYIQYP